MPDFTALSVLMLAWDEAAPTVRTVVEATPAVGTLLVLLPPRAPVAPPATPAEPVAPQAAPLPPSPAASLLAPPVVPAPAPPTLTAPVATLPPALGGVATPPRPAVRVVHLAPQPPAYTAPSGSFRVPSAPYIGATPTAASAAVVTPSTAAPLAPAPLGPLAAPASRLPEPPPTPVVAPVLPIAATPTASTAPTTEPTPPALADAAFRADEVLDPDPAQELHPQTTTPTVTLPATVLAEAPPARTLGPFGKRIPDMEPARVLPRRSALPDDDDDDASQPPLPEPTATAPRYEAPNLNTQIITYARLAVPAALAAGDFEVIYAPAWPTWLAALELRQRTGRPLVLHLSALASGRHAADTAAGWPAETQRQALRRADVVLVESYYLARRLRRELGLTNTTVRVLPPNDAAAIARALHRARRA